MRTTWNSVLADIPATARCGLDLEGILDAIITPNVFRSNPLSCQRAILLDLFGDEHDALVDLILPYTSHCVVQLHALYIICVLSSYPLPRDPNSWS